jgi:serine/threonine protein kinase
MTTRNSETNPAADDALDADLVLTVHPRVTALGGGGTAGDSGRLGNTRVASSDDIVALSSLNAAERSLVALADGRRSITQLVSLSGMDAVTAQNLLRSLCDRGILARPPGEPQALTPPPVNDGSEPVDVPGAAPPDGSGALTKAIDEYLEFAANVLTGGSDRNVVRAPIGTAVVTPGSGPVGADQSSRTQLGMTFAPPPAVAGAAGSAGQTSPAAFKPNVTAFWIPSMGEPPFATESGPDPTVSSTVAISGQVAASGSGSTSTSTSGPTVLVGSGPTVVVTGSPASSPNPTSDSGPARSVPPASDSGPSRSPEAVPVDATRVPSPFRVGGYEVATRIAQGGMGSVYVCRRVGEVGFQRLFALKVVRQHAAQKEEAIRSFKREARVGALLVHPNLQTVRDSGSYKGQPFLILDYVEGASLSELMTEDRRPPVPVAVTVLLDLLRGLQYVHELADEKGAPLGLVHGDVSPQNILVGVDGAARLTDFGSATFSGGPNGRDQERVNAGKPGFMAPEQLRAEPLDARTDIFAAGVVMWTVLTGQKLFAADSYDATIIKVLRKKIPTPSSFGAPACFDDVCLKALSRSPEGRYATADEMAREILNVAVAQSKVASVTDVGEWVRRESGEALAESRSRIQSMFAETRPAPAGRPEVGRSPKLDAVVPIDAPGRRPFQTPKLGATRSLAKTIFLPDSVQAVAPQTWEGSGHKPASSFWRSWRVAIVSALLALPVTLTIGYFVSNALKPSEAGAVRRQPQPAPPNSSVVDAATSE